MSDPKEPTQQGAPTGDTRLQIAFDVLEKEKEEAVKRGDFALAADLRGGSFRLQQIATARAKEAPPSSGERRDVASAEVTADRSSLREVLYDAQWYVGRHSNGSDALRILNRLVDAVVREQLRSEATPPADPSAPETLGGERRDGELVLCGRCGMKRLPQECDTALVRGVVRAVCKSCPLPASQSDQ